MNIKVTLQTMYNFCPDLFDHLVIPSGLDKDTLVQNLVIESGEHGVLYVDGEFMKKAIGFWSVKELPKWEKLYATELLKYDPIDNYNRYEESERDVTGAAQNAETSFDSYSLHTTSGSDSTGKEKFSSHIHGNIGVTTSQQMIEAERKVSEFSTYDFIIRSFANKFLLEIY